MRLRRRLAASRRKQVTDVWPIFPGSQKPPAGWKGWPDGKKFAVVLTHDVEGQIGYDRIKNLARLEQELGFRSSFNLIPEGPYRVEPELRHWLTAQGFEVGVHDLHHDGKLYRSHDEFSRRAHKINRYIREWGVAGFRSAYMHHKLDWLGELDVLYDASTFDTDPFEPQPDGVGTIFPFWVPRRSHLTSSRVAESPSQSNHALSAGYVELPYTLVQDSTLFLFLGEKTIDVWKRKVDWIAQHGGMVLLNLHPDYVSFDDKQCHREFPISFYRQLLTYLSERYAGEFWHALPQDVARRSLPTAPETVGGGGLSDSQDAVRAHQSDVRAGLIGKRAAVLLYSDIEGDPRPRRAAQALVAQGIQVDVLCLKSEPNQPDFEIIDGFHVHRTPMMHDREGGIVRYLIQYSAFLLRAGAFVIKRSMNLKYDLVHVHNMPDFLVFSALPARLRGSRVILDLHDPMPELFQAIYGLGENHPMIGVLKAVERISIWCADRVLTPNLAFQRVFESRSCKPGKIGIVMNSPNESIFRSGAELAQLPDNGASKKPFRVLHHGSIVHRHGLDIAVEAVAIASKSIPSIQFYICGGGNSYLEKVLKLASQLGIEDRVFFLGSKSQAEVARIVEACDVGVIPNRLSPFTQINMPTRIFEYLAMDRPVISPSTVGIRDYFDDSNMLFFKPNDPVDLARQMAWVYENPSAVPALVQRGQVIYHQQLWNRQRELFLDITEELVSS